MDARDDRASWSAPDRMDELDNFLPEDKAAARDFLLEIKPLFPLIEIPAFWDDDEGIELIKHLSGISLQPSCSQTGRVRQRDFSTRRTPNGY